LANGRPTGEQPRRQVESDDSRHLDQPQQRDVADQRSLGAKDLGVRAPDRAGNLARAQATVDPRLPEFAAELGDPALARRGPTVHWSLACTHDEIIGRRTYFALIRQGERVGAVDVPTWHVAGVDCRPWNATCSGADRDVLFGT